MYADELGITMAKDKLIRENYILILQMSKYRGSSMNKVVSLQVYQGLHTFH